MKPIEHEEPENVAFDPEIDGLLRDLRFRTPPMPDVASGRARRFAFPIRTRRFLAPLTGIAATVVLASALLFAVANRSSSGTPTAPATVNGEITAVRWSKVASLPDRYTFASLVETGSRLYFVVDTSEISNADNHVISSKFGVWASADGERWEHVTDVTSNTPPARFAMIGAAGDGHGGLVVTGSDFAEGDAPVAAAWHSSDGRSWTRATVEGAGGRQLIYVASKPGLTVSVSNGADGWYTTDGRRWTASAIGGGVAGGSRSLTTWDGGFATVMNDTSTTVAATVVTTPDGRTWTKREPLSIMAEGVAAYRHGLVVLGGEGSTACGPAAFVSPDGTSWTKANVPAPTSPCTFADAAVDVGGQLVVIGSSRFGWLDEGTPPPTHPSLWVSADGTSWQLLPTDSAPDFGPAPVSGRLLVLFGGRLVYVSQAGVLVGQLVTK